MFTERKTPSSSTSYQMEYKLALGRLDLCIKARSGEEEEKKKFKTKLEKFDSTYLNDTKITNHIPLENLWKLGVDAKDHNFGRMAYDTGNGTTKVAEEGYIDAMETALAFMFKTAHVPLTTTYIRQLHYLASCQVSLQTRDLQVCLFPFNSKNAEGSNLRFGQVPLMYPLVSEEGLTEMATYNNLTIYVPDDPKNPTSSKTKLTPKTVSECWKKFRLAQMLMVQLIRLKKKNGLRK